MNPYRVATPNVVNFSGGRSSGYLLHRILDAYDGDLPDDLPVVFANTGKERPETYEFVRRVAAEWSVSIRWVEFRFRPDAGGGVADPKRSWAEVDPDSASRDGRPFEELIACEGVLPTPTARICTRALKIDTTARFLRSEFGWRKPDFRRVLGIRYDERRRWLHLAETDCRADLPLVVDKQETGDVYRFWRRQTFDLGLESERGNCDLCYLKSRGNLIETIRERPDLADWWIEQERRMSDRRDTASGKADATFRRGTMFADLLAAAREPRDPTLFDGFSASDWAACHCTD